MHRTKTAPPPAVPLAETFAERVVFNLAAGAVAGLAVLLLEQEGSSATGTAMLLAPFCAARGRGGLRAAFAAAAIGAGIIVAGAGIGAAGGKQAPPAAR